MQMLSDCYSFYMCVFCLLEHCTFCFCHIGIPIK